MIKQYALPLPQRTAMAADDFMVTDSNREAVGWLIERAPSSWPSHCLLLHGPKGCGKTHLLNIWQAKNAAYLLKEGENIIAEIVNNCFPHPALALDNADQLMGDLDKEEGLQHLYNATRASKLPLLLTAETPPALWDLKLKDIASRLKSCPAIALREPDDTLMRAMLLKLFNDRQLLVEDGVIEYLAQHLERTGVAVQKTIALLDQKALEDGRKISVPFVQTILNPKSL
ncbi:MAG: hypothetical protein HGA90_00910 [Alphaproteobacteria bacterium]|nr:hypothetical protein [Alphaproteobacteria bacterium]